MPFFKLLLGLLNKSIHYFILTAFIIIIFLVFKASPDFSLSDFRFNESTHFYIISLVYAFLYTFFYLAILFVKGKSRDWYIYLVYALLVLALSNIVVCIFFIENGEPIQFELDEVPPYYFLEKNSLLIISLAFIIPLFGIYILCRKDFFDFASDLNIGFANALTYKKESFIKYLPRGFYDVQSSLESLSEEEELFYLLPGTSKGISKEEEDLEGELTNKEENKNSQICDALFQFKYYDYIVAGAIKYTEIVGGDYYDVWLEQKENGEDSELESILTLSIFDTVGHGIIASFHLFQIIGFLKDRERHFKGKRVTDIIGEFNRRVQEYNRDYQESLSVPLTICRLNSRNSQIIISNCGNISPVHYLKKERRIEVLDFRSASSPGEKYMSEKDIKEKKIDMERDDLLIIGTDGLVANYLKFEAANFERELKRDSSPLQLIDTVYKKMKEHITHEYLNDDAAVIVIKKIK